MRAAVDIGGTFTDILLFDERTGAIWSAKIPSDPHQPARPFIAGLRRVLDAGETEFESLTSIDHATTIATNALLEGKTAKVGLLVTEGFRDVLEIGRQQRPALYDLMKDRLAPLVPRQLVREIRERIAADGHVVTALDLRGAREQIQTLADAKIDALAVALLFSFRNSAHEEQLMKLADEVLPEGTFIFLSSRVLPEFREFERTSTTVIAASVSPRVASYIQSIEQELQDKGWHRERFMIMHSGGGTLPPAEAVRRPHTLIESGPAAGLIATGHLAQTLSLDRVIAFDMGGTTAKAGLVLNGRPQTTSEYEVGSEMHYGGRMQGGGYPIRFPMIDVAECGAGAGSLAWVDTGRHLKVGPESAGADPGPACYGNGGTLPTVTDAHVVLHRLTAEHFLGGDMALFPELAEQALHEHLSGPLGHSVEGAAHGVLSIVNANMLRILRVVSVARGFDPRDFTLVAYGGAGPLHATDLAEGMGIRRVIVPRLPGLFSALGLLYANTSTDFVETVMVRLTGSNVETLNEVLNQLRSQAMQWFERIGVAERDRMLTAEVDLRYVRQNYELKVTLPTTSISRSDIPLIQKRFDEAHELTYGHSAPGEAIRVVNVRLRMEEERAAPQLPMLEAAHTLSPDPQAMRQVWFSGKPTECAVYDRSRLAPQQTTSGPAIIREETSTTVVNPGWFLRVDRFGNLVLTLESRAGEQGASERLEHGITT